MPRRRRGPVKGTKAAVARRAKKEYLPGQGKLPPKVAKQAIETTCPNVGRAGHGKGCTLCHGTGKTKTIRLPERQHNGGKPMSHIEYDNEAIAEMGGRVTAPALAKRLRLQHTAALNRLTPLVDKGFLYRKRRAGRIPDLFCDPRFPDAAEVAERMLDATQTELPEAEQAAFADQLRSRRAADRLPNQF